MTEKEIEHEEIQEAASELSHDSIPVEEEAEQEVAENEKKVPLAALEAERRKRQELEGRIREYESRQQEEYDPEEIVERGMLDKMSAQTKREILEQVFIDTNPQAVQKINKYLQPILEQKPWLLESIQSAPNRYARSFEIVNDYINLVEEKAPTRSNDYGDRIVKNAQKPGSPVAVAKSANPSNIDLLKSVQGKKEWQEIRNKMRSGQL